MGTPCGESSPIFWIYSETTSATEVHRANLPLANGLPLGANQTVAAKRTEAVSTLPLLATAMQQLKHGDSPVTSPGMARQRRDNARYQRHDCRRAVTQNHNNGCDRQRHGHRKLTEHRHSAVLLA